VKNCFAAAYLYGNIGGVTPDCETTTLFEATYSGDSHSEIEVCMVVKNCSEY